MNTTEKSPKLSGFILIDKPIDWTSHDVVGFVRKIVNNFYKKVGLPTEVPIKIGTKVGHAGTLDPFATGLLIVGIGREATKKLDQFKALPKEYEAVIKLGATSDTQDRTGTITSHETHITSQIFNEQIDKVLEKFIGKQQQTPPMFSAKKVGGKKLYNLARQGIEIERKPNDIEVYRLNLLNYDPKCLLLRVSCLVSTGTYIRTLAHDIGQAIVVPRDGVLRGVGAYCEELRRTKIGNYSVENAIIPKDLNPEYLSNYIFNL